MRPQLFGILAAATAIPVTLADVEFTYPAAGSTVDADTSITVKWTDGGSPPISAFTTYSLSLCAGGNDEGSFIPLTAFQSTGSFTGGNSVTIKIPSGVGGSTKNAYFLSIQSVVAKGGTVTNYSPRFSVSGMTGAFPADVLAGLKTISPGDTTSPPTLNLAVKGGEDPGAVNAPAGAWDTPFAEQDGLTKYAPMQKIPPTSITATNTQPLYPTTAFQIAQTYLAPAKQKTTVTQLQTFAAQSKINTAAPASQPTPDDDMAKFLRRWRD